MVGTVHCGVIQLLVSSLDGSVTSLIGVSLHLGGIVELGSHEKEVGLWRL